MNHWRKYLISLKSMRMSINPLIQSIRIFDSTSHSEGRILNTRGVTMQQSTQAHYHHHPLLHCHPIWVTNILSQVLIWLFILFYMTTPANCTCKFAKEGLSHSSKMAHICINLLQIDPAFLYILKASSSGGSTFFMDSTETIFMCLTFGCCITSHLITSHWCSACSHCMW